MKTLENHPAMTSAGEMLIESLKAGNSIFICGNGGSAEQANHFAAELVGRFKRPGRRPLAAFSLSANTAVITAIANDFGFEEVFARQVRAAAGIGDVVIGISTSGTSRNVVEALKAAKAVYAQTMAMVAYDYDSSKENVVDLADLSIIANGMGAAAAQEDHLRMIHYLCDMVDEAFTPQQTSEDDSHGTGNTSRAEKGGQKEGHEEKGHEEGMGTR